MAELVKLGDVAVKQDWISISTTFVEDLIVIQTTIFNTDEWNTKIRSGGLFRIKYPTFYNLVTKPEYFPVDNDWKLFDIALTSELVEYVGNKKFNPYPKTVEVKLSSNLVEKYSMSSFAPWGVSVYKIVE
ncbi:MAG: hypothetical protein QNJ51_03045 [Calothrix sp. MO_167.B12]|nr:hypothetical protein [Calothrix sp. MO_167.B12]